VKLPEITVEAPKTNYRVNLDMLGINPFNWPKYIPESYWDSDTHKAIKEGNNITAGIVTAPILVAAASKVLPYMSAKGILAATNAAGITPGWFTPTVASVIDTSIAGAGLGSSLNDIRKNGPTFGNVLGTGLSALGFAVLHRLLKLSIIIELYGINLYTMELLMYSMFQNHCQLGKN